MRALLYLTRLTLVIRRGGGVATTPKQFSPWCSKIFRFILSLHFSEKKFAPTIFPGGRVSFQSWEVGVGAIPWFYNLVILEIILNDNCNFLTYSNLIKIACFHIFLPKNQFLPIFCTQNDNFSIFEALLTFWRHSDVIH